MEFALSKVCGNHSSYIGFWGGQPISFTLLRPETDHEDDFFVQGMMLDWGLSEDRARENLAVLAPRWDWAIEVGRGYSGWLTTNRVFLEEHRKVFQNWADEVAHHGIPNMGPVARDSQAVPDSQLAEGRLEQYVRAFEAFFIRWRLNSMPAPFVPQPMAVQLPVTDLRPVVGHMRHGGTTFYIPDICPVPSRDKLRDILEEALRNRNGPGYLEEWFDRVHSDNVAKNQIPHYARVFELQHYMRALYARHAGALERKKSVLILAISAYLDVSDDTIERDLGLITGRLGPDWYLASA